jgi:uncharacterized protein (TIGR03000 family)
MVAAVLSTSSIAPGGYGFSGFSGPGGYGSSGFAFGADGSVSFYSGFGVAGGYGSSGFTFGGHPCGCLGVGGYGFAGFSGPGGYGSSGFRFGQGQVGGFSAQFNMAGGYGSSGFAFGSAPVPEIPARMVKGFASASSEPAPMLEPLVQGERAEARQATIVVNLPADAVMFIDGRQSGQSSDLRTIITPNLNPNKDYTYTIKAEAIRDGRRVEKIERVTFRAGATVNVRLDLVPQKGRKERKKKGQESEEAEAALRIEDEDLEMTVANE